MVSDQFSPRLFQGMDETKIGTSRPPLRPKGNAVAVAHLVSVVSLTGDRETLWGGRRGNGNFVAGCNRWSAAMPQPNAVAENGDQIALTPRLHPQYAEPVLLVVEGDALHQATEDLGRCACAGWLPHGGDLILAPHTTHASRDIDPYALARVSRHQVSGNVRPGGTFEKAEQLVWKEAGA